MVTPGPDRLADLGVHLGHDPAGRAHLLQRLGRLAQPTSDRLEHHGRSALPADGRGCGRRRRGSSRRVTSSGWPRPSTAASRSRLLVPGDERLGLLGVELEAVADRLLGVVVALERPRRRSCRRSSRSGAGCRPSSWCRSRRTPGAWRCARRRRPRAPRGRATRSSGWPASSVMLGRAPRPGRRCGGSRRGCSPRLVVSSRPRRSCDDADHHVVGQQLAARPCTPWPCARSRCPP